MKLIFKFLLLFAIVGITVNVATAQDSKAPTTWKVLIIEQSDVTDIHVVNMEAFTEGHQCHSVIDVGISQSSINDALLKNSNQILHRYYAYSDKRHKPIIQCDVHDDTAIRWHINQYKKNINYTTQIR